VSQVSRRFSVIRSFCSGSDISAASRSLRLSSVSLESLQGALRGRRDIATSTSEHIEQYLSEKSTRVSRQSLRHVVAQLWAFCRYGLASGLVRNGLDVCVVLEDIQAQQELLIARSDLVVIMTELNPQQYAPLHSSDASCALGEEAVFCERMPLRRRWPHDSQDRRALRTGLKRKEHAMSCTIDSNRVSGGGD